MRQGKTMLYPLLVASLMWAAGSASAVRSQTAATPKVTLFEGARLITGDGSAAIENSAFVVENDLFTRVGRRGELSVPPSQPGPRRRRTRRASASAGPGAGAERVSRVKRDGAR